MNEIGSAQPSANMLRKIAVHFEWNNCLLFKFWMGNEYFYLGRVVSCYIPSLSV